MSFTMPSLIGACRRWQLGQELSNGSPPNSQPTYDLASVMPPVGDPRGTQNLEFSFNSTFLHNGQACSVDSME